MGKGHDAGKWFSYGTRHNLLMLHCPSVGAAKVRIKLDLNGTRVTARHGLLHSLCRLKRPLRMFQVESASVPWKLSDLEWHNIRDSEGVLTITDKAVKLVHNEKSFMGAVALLLKTDVLKTLRAKRISVIDLEAVKSSPRMPRINVPVQELSEVSQECLRRACLEAERRHCGNTGETLSGDDYQPTDRELGATLLDFRTIHGHHLSKSVRDSAYEVLQDGYVKYATTAHAFRKAKAKAAAQSSRNEEAGSLPAQGEQTISNRSSSCDSQSGDDLGLGA
eukprot:Plantae.Rhodophyta-Palmaria_palmata.ctg2734.p1 GENE.Plantae.Rhodophyta-Palmaria_palmata.ctg2734~~Plantae.Rhodophyta-Palmaria_palmata.ctg2734.p1  ORF type:complete len:278 (+),score=27.42 Plantae.Rhodophyta-Palmaria_palmata.ctg2734:373-1206(+)